MTAEVLRTVIADDHAPTRMGVRQALELDGFVSRQPHGQQPRGPGAPRRPGPFGVMGGDSVAG